MRPPRMSSIVERRLLVNYRVAPDVAARLLPPGLRPQLVNGWAVAGICLIRLARARPTWLPASLGLRSENAMLDCAMLMRDMPATWAPLPRRRIDEVGAPA